LSPKGWLRLEERCADKKETHKEGLTVPDPKFQSIIDPGVRALLDATADQILIHSLDGRILWANESFCHPHGIDRDRLDEIEPWAWVPPQTRAHHDGILGTLRTDGSHVFDSVIETPEGSRFLECSARVVELDGEKLVMSVARDRTAERGVLEELRLKSMLLDQANDAIVVYDADGRIRYVNESACAERGYTRDEYLALSLDQIGRAHV